MVCLLIFGLLIASMPVYRSQLKVAACLNIIIASLLLIFRLLPGTAHFVDWLFMAFFILDSAAFFFTGEEVITS